MQYNLKFSVSRSKLIAGLLAMAFLAGFAPLASAAEFYAVFSWIPSPATRALYPDVQLNAVKNHPMTRIVLEKRPSDGKWTMTLALPDSMIGGGATSATLVESAVLSPGFYRLTGAIGKMDCFIDADNLGVTSCQDLDLHDLPGTTAARQQHATKYYAGTPLENGMNAMAGNIQREPYGDLLVSEYDEYSGWAPRFSGEWNSLLQNAQGQYAPAPMRITARGGAYHPPGPKGGLFTETYYDPATQELFLRWELGRNGESMGWALFKLNDADELDGRWGYYDQDGNLGPMVGLWKATRAPQ